MNHHTNKLRGRLLILLLGAYFLVFRAQAVEWGPEWLRFHLADFLFIPTLLLSTGAVGDLLGRPIRITDRRIAIAVIYSAVVFEWVLPASGMAFEGDVVDVCCYILGGITFRYLSRAMHRDRTIDPRRTQNRNRINTNPI